MKEVEFIKYYMLIVLILLLSACSQNVVKEGDTVGVEYTGRLQNGEIFDESNGKILTFTVGNSDLLPVFEEAVIGMKLGEEKDFSIPPRQAYGVSIKERIITTERENAHSDQELKVGQVLVAERDGEQITGKIIELTDDKITVDFNHPLAGETLYFHIKVVSIE